jgi:predicted transcriptional regulator
MERRKEQKQHVEIQCEESTKKWVQERVAVCETASKNLNEARSRMEKPINNFNNLYSTIVR